MTNNTYPASHFMAVGKHVESAYEEGRTGTVVKDLGDGTVLVDWLGYSLKTVCTPFDLEPLEA